MNEIKKYRIQKGDTLESIAKKLNITVEGLRSFHNQHCELENLLGPKLKKIPELYIQSYSSYVDNTISTDTKVDLTQALSNNILKRRYTKINKTYGVIQEIFENEEKIIQIHYIVKIGNDVSTQLSYNQLYIRRYKTYVDEKEIDGNIEHFSEQLDQILYPLKISLDEKGVPLSIINKKEIEARWFEEKRKQFIRYYNGNLAKVLLRKLDNFFTHIGNYESQILNSLFYTFFFMPLYVPYGENREYHYEKEIPIFPFKKKVNYKISQKLDNKKSASGKIFVHMEGVCIEERTGVEIAQGISISKEDSMINITPEGKLKFTYKLDDKTKILFSAIGYISLKINSQITRKIKIKIYET